MGGNGGGVVVQLPSGVQREVKYIGLLELNRGSSLDPVASLITYSRSCDNDSDWVEPAQLWYGIRTSSPRGEYTTFQNCD